MARQSDVVIAGVFEGAMTMAAKKPRSTKDFTTLDEVLDQDGTREAFQAVAIQEVLTWQNSIHRIVKHLILHPSVMA